MTEAGHVRIPLRSIAAVLSSRVRRREPVTVGFPLPAGAVPSVDRLTLEDASGQRVPVQAAVSERWPDGSIRWVLLDMLADSTDGVARYTVVAGDTAAVASTPSLSVASTPHVRIDTGAVVVECVPGEAFPVSRATGTRGTHRDLASAGLTCVVDGRRHEVLVASARVVETGLVRTTVEVVGQVEGFARPLAVTARLHFWSDSPVVEVGLALHNPSRAVHAGGQWGLGDPGSLLFDGVELRIGPGFVVSDAHVSLEIATPPGPRELPFSLSQESSGGPRWDGQTHRDRTGAVPLRWRGYRYTEGATHGEGEQAQPTVELRGANAEARLAVAVPQFWQHFPASVRVDREGVVLGVWPTDAPGPHELQGGERRVWRAMVSFGTCGVTPEPLAWVHERQILFPPADWVCQTGAVPFLISATEDPSAGYADLVDLGLDAERGFVAKRNDQDEYGWRHFGDLPADHESAFQPSDRPFISHYNNQYDPIAGFAYHFLRTGDRRWWELMDDLARHVAAVDIYQTTEDKSAYNGGLFWHTAHYLDAGTSTHRTYPPGSVASGGPSAEHNYNTGLMLHAWLTGSPDSRDRAIGLGQWVIDMDDGSRTVFGWLSSAPTGHASYTNGWYGPGRGAGHSILACLAAHRLSGEARFLDKATELVRRTIHPSDVIESFNLLDAELRWSYTAFLQAVGAYLWRRLELGLLDGHTAYARESLLHYARWMASHERFYLDHPEGLEYPTETWVAQDLRKGDVFVWAALVAPQAERGTFVTQAERFFRGAIESLSAMPTRHYTRPVVIALTHGLRYGWMRRHAIDAAAPNVVWPALGHEPRSTFVPQRQHAIRRALVLATLGGALAVAVLAWVVTRWW